MVSWTKNTDGGRHSHNIWGHTSHDESDTNLFEYSFGKVDGDAVARFDINKNGYIFSLKNEKNGWMRLYVRNY